MNFLKRIYQAFIIAFFTRQVKPIEKLCFLWFLFIAIFCVYYTATYPYAWDLKDTEYSIGIYENGKVFGKGGGSCKCEFATENGIKILIVPYNECVKLGYNVKYKLWFKKYKLRPFTEKYKSYQIQSIKTNKYIQPFEYSSFSVLVMGLWFSITIFISFIAFILVGTNDKKFTLKDRTWR